MAATEFAVATLSVEYSMLPAQFASFSGEAKDVSSSGIAAAAVQSLMKVRFFIPAKYAQPSEEYSHYSASRLVTVTRKTGLDFSAGSISNVWEVLAGS